MFATYLIGLREGLEATLVVTILIAYLVKTDNRDRLRWVWLGIIAAVLLSLGVGAVLQFASDGMPFRTQETFGGVLSILAVGLVTWMVFWMRRTARFLKAELEGRMEAALAMGGLALAITSFLAVGREGLETAAFIWGVVQSTGQGWHSLAGALLGIASAVVLGWLLYRRAIRINLAKFFTWTGAGLIIVAAGVLSYGFHDLQEASILPGLDSLAFDVSGTIPPDSWYGSLLKGVLNFQPQTTKLQAVVWLLYVVPCLFFFFRPPRSTPAPAAPSTTTPARATH